MKSLFIIRHAKSSWKTEGLSDFDRPLNSRGIKDVPLMAEIVKNLESFDGLFLSSPAKRALTTSRGFQKTWNVSDERFKEDSRLYHSSYGTLIEILREQEEKHNEIAVFGHNPGLSILASMLCNQNINLTTCNVIKIDIHLDSWSLIDSNTGSLVYHEYPRKHYDE